MSVIILRYTFLCLLLLLQEASASTWLLDSTMKYINASIRRLGQMELSGAFISESCL